MNLNQLSSKSVLRSKKIMIVTSLLVTFALLISACAPVNQGATSSEAPAEATAAPAEATEAPAAEATEAPAEEATEAPAEEATAAPAEEATAAPAEEASASTGDAANGEYIATLTGGCGCHFNSDLGGLAGGNKFEGPFGVAYASNLTPDPETGLGSWTPEMIVSVLHTGSVVEGTETEHMVPAMPYMRFAALSTQEAYDVAAWLMSLEPIVNEVPARELTGEVAAWTPENPPAETAPTDPTARGEQLVVLADCGGCHTPKNEDGSRKADMLLAGAPVREEMAANITPDEATGIGSWTEEQIATYLRTGAEPDGAQAEGAMGQQIERRFSKLTEGDAAAIAAYLKSIPAVSNDMSQ